jgi:cytochrome o ubiquinol oxidase operon protein cyoD
MATGLVASSAFTNSTLLATALVALALMQFAVQLICFLHVGQEKRHFYNSAALAFALIVVCIIVGGTLWIMSNVSREHPTPEAIVEMEASTLTPLH